MADRSHLSIGEVLSLLREEFPDVTISKIRFLESQGLVDPERTPSGYRKFYDHDVERLRWILRQQREHFLPLKVIRGRLSEQAGADSTGNGTDANDSPQPAEPAVVTAGYDSTGPATAGEPGSPPPARSGPAAPPAGAGREGNGGADAGAGRTPGRPAATPSLFASLHGGPPAGPAGGPAETAPGRPVTANETAPAPAPSPTGAAPAAGTPAATGPSGRSEEPETYTADELARAAGADASLVTDLKQYGLIAPHAVVAGTQYYDAAAVAVARAAVEFSRHGVEARHLRIWRNAADREADLFQQVVLPLLRQRNPQARRQALDTLAELSRAGADLRAALVERALREIR